MEQGQALTDAMDDIAKKFREMSDMMWNGVYQELDSVRIKKDKTAGKLRIEAKTTLHWTGDL